MLNYVVDFTDTNNSFAVMNIPVGLSKTYDGYTWNVSEKEYPDGFVRVDKKYYKQAVPHNFSWGTAHAYVKGYPEFDVIVTFWDLGIYDDERKIVHNILDPRDKNLMFINLKSLTDDKIEFDILATRGYVESFGNNIKLAKEKGGRTKEIIKKNITTNFKKLNKTEVYIGTIEDLHNDDDKYVLLSGNYRPFIHYTLWRRLTDPEEKYDERNLYLLPVWDPKDPEKLEKWLRERDFDVLGADIIPGVYIIE